MQDEFILLHFILPLIRGLRREVVPSGGGQRQVAVLCPLLTPEIVICLETMAFKDGFKCPIIKESEEQGVAWLR
jgi:hypothetical protein